MLSPIGIIKRTVISTVVISSPYRACKRVQLTHHYRFLGCYEQRSFLSSLNLDIPQPVESCA